MATKKVVGISQRIDVIESRHEIRDALDQKLIAWVGLAGFIVVPIPNIFMDKSSLIDWVSAVHLDALILSGGNNIGDFAHRDSTEHLLLDWAYEKKIPTLGICRGMQMMATWANVELIQCNNHVNLRHKLSISDNSDISDKWPDTVNSYHDWCISACPKMFTVTARSEDGVIEAIAHKDLPWEAWMWHPERESQFSLQDTQRLVHLFR